MSSSRNARQPLSSRLPSLLLVLLLALPGMVARAQTQAAETSGEQGDSEAAPTTDALLRAVGKWMETGTAIKAKFHQVAYNASVGMSRTSEGDVKILIPGRMLWSYSSPREQLMLADGKRIWIYEKDAEAVYTGELASATGSSIPALVLAGARELTRDFHVRPVDLDAAREVWPPEKTVEGVETRADAGGEDQDTRYLQLLPKQPQPSFQRLLLEVHPDTGSISRVGLIDHYGNRTAIALEQVERNTDLDAEVFRIQFPDDTMWFDFQGDEISAVQPGRD